jgi:DNA-binding Lrp family transcriptional regulator
LDRGKKSSLYGFQGKNEYVFNEYDGIFRGDSPRGWTRGRSYEGAGGLSKLKVDEIDVAIVDFLHHDSLMTASRIAENLSVHPSTVTYRINKLREMGVIKKFTVSIDWRKLGKSVEAAILISCSPRSVSKVAKRLASMGEVVEVHSLTGVGDILAMVMLTDMGEYKDFIEKRLGEISEIESVRAGIVLEDYKEE